MESLYPELVLCGSKIECARTDTVFLHLSEVSKGTVLLLYSVCVFVGLKHIRKLKKIFLQVIQIMKLHFKGVLPTQLTLIQCLSF